jgi:hypothetical protein
MRSGGPWKVDWFKNRSGGMNGIGWIASFPKSGNTWLRCMLATYIAGEPVETWKEIQDWVPDLDTLLRNGDLPSTAAERPVLVKTHFMADVPVLGVFREETIKALHLVRNPRDILLSLIRAMGISREDVESCRKVAESFIANEGAPGWRNHALGTWPAFTRTWTESVKECFPHADVLTVRYEDLRADTVEVFREIVEFLGIGRPVLLDEIRNAVESCTLDRMREMEERSKAQGSPAVKVMGPRGAGGVRIGGGGIGGAGIGGGGSAPFVGEGKHAQSLSFMGDDIETAYLELVTGDSQFAHYAKQFGYVD